MGCSCRVVFCPSFILFSCWSFTPAQHSSFLTSIASSAELFHLAESTPNFRLCFAFHCNHCSVLSTTCLPIFVGLLLTHPKSPSLSRVPMHSIQLSSRI